MGSVSCFTLNGCDIFFNSMDHRPPHIHVINVQAGWHIRVFIETTTQKKLDYTIKRPPKASVGGSIQRKLRKKIVDNRAKLLKEWSKKVKEV